MRKKITKKSQQLALRLLDEAMAERLREKGTGTFASSHEVLGVIQEEFDELLAAVRGNDITAVKYELLDIAVGAIFGVACIEQETLDW